MISLSPFVLPARTRIAGLVLALLAAPICGPARAESTPPEAPALGRVFFSPAERHALELERARAAGDAGAQRFNGWVSGGGRVHAWVDGQQNSAAVAGTKVVRLPAGAAGPMAFDPRSGELVVAGDNGGHRRLRAGESGSQEEGAALRPVAAARK